jgi:hypothetical protein
MPNLHRLVFFFFFLLTPAPSRVRPAHSATLTTSWDVSHDDFPLNVDAVMVTDGSRRTEILSLEQRSEPRTVHFVHKIQRDKLNATS